MMNKVLFGIDIGGTTVKCGLFTLNGELLEKSEIPTDKQDNGRKSKINAKKPAGQK